MHGGKRQRLAAKKSLAEIESATEALRARGLASLKELYTLIMTVGGLSDADRRELLSLANKAVTDMIASIGFQKMTSDRRFKHTGAQMARSGKAEKAAAWHGEVEKLVAALWERRPDFRGNAEKTAQKIYPELEIACRQLGLAAPRPGTVAKFIAAKMKPTDGAD